MVNTEILIIKMKDIRKIYKMGKEEVEVLKGINLEVKKGEFIAIMGPSGAGKSTLMNIMGCLDRPTSGYYELDGVDVTKLSDNELSKIRNRKIGFVFQSFHLIPWASAVENVLLPLVYRNGITKGDVEKAVHLLERLGLKDRLNFKPSELSGGQQQRIAIARALIVDPALILADEPTGNLDSKAGREVMEIFTELNKEGRTIVVNTHDPEVSSYAQRIKILKDGIFVE